MRVAVIGAGGVGGYYGARLAAAGHEVALLCRGKTLEAIRKNGLRVESAGAPPLTVHPQALELQELVRERPFDLVLWCVKATQNEEAARGLDPLVTEGTWWLPFQNGVEAEKFLRKRFPRAQVLGGTCYISALPEAPGVVRHYAAGHVTMGDIGFSDPPRTPEILERLRRTFEGAGVAAHVSGNIRAAKWKKLVWNASLNTLSAITGASATALLSFEATREWVRAAMYEVVDVAGVLGVELSRKDADQHIQLTRALPEVRTSMLWDMQQGRPLEHEALCGVVVRLGEREGVETPVLRTLYTLLQEHDAGPRAAPAAGPLPPPAGLG